MEKEDKEALQVAKEIVVKFIEAQRISPANFPELFPEIYRVVLNTIRSRRLADHPEKKDAASCQGPEA